MITIQTTRIFDEWMRHLKDKQAVMAIAVRIRRAEDGNFGDVKPVGEGVSEMRIHVGAGYRVYFKKSAWRLRYFWRAVIKRLNAKTSRPRLI